MRVDRESKLDLSEAMRGAAITAIIELLKAQGYSVQRLSRGAGWFYPPGENEGIWFDASSSDDDMFWQAADHMLEDYYQDRLMLHYQEWKAFMDQRNKS